MRLRKYHSAPFLPHQIMASKTRAKATKNHRASSRAIKKATRASQWRMRSCRRQKLWDGRVSQDNTDDLKYELRSITQDFINKNDSFELNTQEITMPSIQLPGPPATPKDESLLSSPLLRLQPFCRHKKGDDGHERTMTLSWSRSYISWSNFPSNIYFEVNW